MADPVVLFTAERLRTIRLAHDLSKTAAASLAGIDRRCLERYEKAECPIPSDALYRFATNVNVPVSEFYPKQVVDPEQRWAA